MQLTKKLLITITNCCLLRFVTAAKLGPLGPPINPKPRAVHSSVILKDLMIVYGGIDGSSTDPYSATSVNDLFVFNISSGLWYQPDVKNSPTDGVKFHAATSTKDTNSMYVFSGFSSSLRILNVETWEWTLVSGPNPGDTGTSIGSTLIASQDRLFAYGGVQLDGNGSPDTTKVLDFLYVYDLSSKKWVLGPNGNNLYFHASCVAPGQNEAIIFGGATNMGEVVSSVISLGVASLRFYLNRMSSQSPPQLIGSTLSCIGSNGVLIGGGGLDWKATNSLVQVIDGNGGVDPNNPEVVWSKPTITNESASPGARIGHTSVEYNGDIYVFGGVGETDTNVYRLKTDDWSWEIIIPILSPSSNLVSEDNKSDSTPTLIISIVGALFGILTMGVIIAVGLRHWRKKNPSVNNPSLLEETATRGSPRTRAWSDHFDTTLTHRLTCSLSHSRASSLEGRPSLVLHPSHPFSGLPYKSTDELGNWTSGEFNHSAVPTQDDSNLPAPVLYARPLSSTSSRPLQDSNLRLDLGSTSKLHRLSMSETPLPWVGMALEATTRAYSIPSTSESVSKFIRSKSDNYHSVKTTLRPRSPLISLEESEVQSGLSTPTSSIKNWPFTAEVHPNVSNLPPVKEDTPGLQLGFFGSGLDPILLKKLALQYRFLASYLVQTGEDVFSMYATDVSTLVPVTIRIYRDKQLWGNATEMHQILKGPFVSKIQDAFIVSASVSYYILVTERLGTSLSGILRRQTQPFSDDDLAFLIRNIALIADFCHSRGVVLADLQLGNFGFSPDNSYLMLETTDSCLVEKDYYPYPSPPRYCPPELAKTFLTRVNNSVRVLPSFDSWALGCLIYELYSRKPVKGNVVPETEASRVLVQGMLRFSGTLSDNIYWKSGSLELPHMKNLSPEVRRMVRSLLKYHPHHRDSPGNILKQPLFLNVPQQFSIFSSLTQPLPLRFSSGELNVATSAHVLALRKQVVATSEIRVPRLVVILPTLRAGRDWLDPSKWDANTFQIYFLCEGTPGLHFSRHSGIPLTNPKNFLSQVGLLISIVSQLCILYLSPDLFGEMDPESLESLLSISSDPEVYFHHLSQILESFCASVLNQDMADAARRLHVARKSDSPNHWLGEWVVVAREVLTHTRHLALHRVRDLLLSEDPHLGLIYTQPLATLHHKPHPTLSSSTWQTWLCITHYHANSH